ncbi:CBS domain-containing protein [Pedobacter sp. HMF7647]|uniref:CBS domain-containing protein n=1 Tax=Hufsiella arboris TaxID=2695275 RepID=A0A7K1YDK4_9SPHI|nr:chloride channel protein [Hufsiella arboris]MXV52159.1 CBS domain-containing protein [Hufsiella arboris]
MTERLKAFLNEANSYRRRKMSNTTFMIIAALIVGVFAGAAAGVLKVMTHHIEQFLQEDVQWKYKFIVYLLFPSIGMLLAVTYVRQFIKKSKFESGLTPILYSISKQSSRIDLHNIYSQLITSAVTVGFGGSTGLEAPVVYSGSAIGSNIGRFFGLNYRETTMLLACGAAAAIAGAFNSPVAGVVFAIEILLPEFSIPAFIPLLLSAATASVIGKLIFNEQLFYLITEGWKLNAVLFYLVFAVVLGFFSIFFTRITHLIKGSFKKIHNPYYKIVIGGMTLGLLVFIFPALYGEGYITIKELLAGNYTSIVRSSQFSAYSDSAIFVVTFALLTAFGKALASLVTLSAGGNGGVFGPSLVMGGLLGFVFSYGFNLTGLFHLSVPNFIVAGMAGALSGIMHAPLTGIFLIAEITGGYELMVPLMVVSSISYFISKANQKYSIYTKALAEKGELLSHEDKDKTVLQMMKLKYLVDKNFVVLHLNDTPETRKSDIIQSKRNVFPVIDNDGVLVSIVYSEQLFETMFDEKKNITVEKLAQPPIDVLNINDDMSKVMSMMEREDVWMLPVVDYDNKYIGFVSKSAIFSKYRALLLRQSEYHQ